MTNAQHDMVHPEPAESALRTLIVVGTRPEAIKLAPVALRMRDDSRFEPVVLTTGQHGHVVGRALSDLGVCAEVNLEPTRTTGSLAELHSQLIMKIDAVVAERHPKVVVVEGDTSSALVAAEVAFWRGSQVAHVEAGLRSGDMTSPFPEEGNRRLIARLAQVHLAPTALAARNLIREGVAPSEIYLTGNPVIDALRTIAASASHQGRWESRLVVVTAHRRESWGEPMSRLVKAVIDLAGRFTDHTFVLATHMNPSVQASWAPAASMPNVELSGPLDYPDFVRLLASARLVITDSGGVQEEAPAFGVPVLVTRDTTERPEGIQAGIARLVGTQTSVVVDQASKLLSDKHAYSSMSRAVNPYGDGAAARRILEAILHSRGLGAKPDDFTPYEAR